MCTLPPTAALPQAVETGHPPALPLLPVLQLASTTRATCGSGQVDHLLHDQRAHEAPLQPQHSVVVQWTPASPVLAAHGCH